MIRNNKLPACLDKYDADWIRKEKSQVVKEGLGALIILMIAATLFMVSIFDDISIKEKIIYITILLIGIEKLINDLIKKRNNIKHIDGQVKIIAEVYKINISD